MKGDSALPFRCPVEPCGVVMNPKHSRSTSKHHATPRTLVRRAAREHINAYHPGLQGRAMSVLLDALCDGLGFA